MEAEISSQEDNQLYLKSERASVVFPSSLKIYLPEAIKETGLGNSHGGDERGGERWGEGGPGFATCQEGQKNILDEFLTGGNLVNMKNAEYLMRLVPPELDCIKRPQDSICTFAKLESHHDPTKGGFQIISMEI